LPNRRSVVITDVPGEKIEGSIMAYSIDEAIEKMEAGKENFIIGGGSVYRQFLPFADKLYLTLVNKDFEADIYFPEIANEQWNIVSKEECIGEEFTYSFVDLERKEN
jgi:dihydrofolate reductase